VTRSAVGWVGVTFSLLQRSINQPFKAFMPAKYAPTCVTSVTVPSFLWQLLAHSLSRRLACLLFWQLVVATIRLVDGKFVLLTIAALQIACIEVQPGPVGVIAC
jgi:hypothetical protein